MTEDNALVALMKDQVEAWLVEDDASDWWKWQRQYALAADRIEALTAENERLREANGILEDALQEVGDDYPGSSCQAWCQQQVKAARAALAGDSHD